MSGQSPDYLSQAAERAKMLSRDLSKDLASLNKTSPRVLSSQERERGQQLVNDAMLAAQQLVDSLSGK